ncbi:MAG TPA: ABC transporter ATP-binding protein, partial [Burkholderiaceae bacterium]|nr:ABC transporter ATP-binding protein [Burkholderiaceae bacterium]
LQVLATALAPDGGAARVLGRDVVADAAWVRARIGVVFQEPTLDDRLSAAENLRIHAALHRVPRSAARARIADALAAAGIEPAARPVGLLSAGMRRRLELARALLHRPAVLLLDEPASGVDAAARRGFWERLFALRGDGLTVFVATHASGEADACDRVALIDRGRLLACGAPAELKRTVLGGNGGSLDDVMVALTSGGSLRDAAALPPSWPARPRIV